MARKLTESIEKSSSGRVTRSRSQRVSKYADKAPTLNSYHIQPKTDAQNNLLRAIDASDLVVTIGPAGTGKTYCSCMKAAQLFSSGKFDSVILCRANVPTGRSLGAFPGTVEEKLAPWLAPMLSVLRKAMTGAKFEYYVSKRQISMQPIETIRGQSFDKALILVDEAQNLTIDELKSITTRIGEGSKMILMGDPAQSDLGKSTSLAKFAGLCEKHSINVPIIYFTIDDIVRSDIVGDLVRMFTRENI